MRRILTSIFNWFLLILTPITIALIGVGQNPGIVEHPHMQTGHVVHKAYTERARSADPPPPRTFLGHSDLSELWKPGLKDGHSLKQLIVLLRILSRQLIGSPELFKELNALLDLTEDLFNKLQQNHEFWESLCDLAEALADLDREKEEQKDYLKHIRQMLDKALLTMVK
ncbi:MAG: hypothetical protein WAN43_02170 [Rhodomicrobium sp.]